MLRKPLERFEASEYAILVCLLLALAIQLFQLGARTFHGDEFGSIAEALAIGRNANSLPFFGVLRLSLALGVSEFWLRVPSVFASVLAVAVTYVWTAQLASRRIGLVAALLLATSPFLIAYSQLVRFYAVGLLAAGLCCWAYVRWGKAPTSRKLGWWGVSALVAMACLALNSLLVLGQLVSAFLMTGRLPRRVKAGILVAATVVLASALLIPQVRAVGFDTLALYTNAESRYASSRGLAAAQLAKIPLNYFFFVFGETVYPLTWSLVVPGTILFLAAGVLGLVALWGNRPAFVFAVVTSASSVGLLYLVFDSLAPASLQGAAPRYLIFLLPILYLVVAAGVQGRWSRWLLVPLLLVNAGGLYEYWYGNWSYSDDLVNWREVTKQVGKYVTPETLVLVDGRAQASANYYFPKDWHTDSAWNYGADGKVEIDPNIKRVILISSTTGAEERARNTALMAELAQNMTRTAGWGHFPLFLYVWERRDAQSKQGGAALELPAELYGLEFQDLPLPVLLGGGTEPLESSAALGLPTLTGETSRKVNLPLPRKAKQVQLYSTLTGAEPPAGTVVARLVVHGADGSVQTIPLRAGYETAAWDGECEAGACVPAAAWHKRLALVGAQRYEGSWRDFEAKIWVATIPLEPTEVSAVELERVTKDGTLYVWGLELE